MHSKPKVLDCLLTQLVLKSSSKCGRIVEERMICWTNNNKNLKSWLDDWSIDLVGLGFPESIQGKNVIQRLQLQNIVNIDDACLVLDGSRSGKTCF